MKTLLKILKAPWIVFVWLLVLPTRLFVSRPVLSLNLPPPEPPEPPELSLSDDEAKSRAAMHARERTHWEHVLPSTRSPIPINAAKVAEEAHQELEIARSRIALLETQLAHANEYAEEANRTSETLSARIIGMKALANGEQKRRAKARR